MILVTGAGGFIGSQVCRLLAAQGYPVVAIDRRFAMIHLGPASPVHSYSAQLLLIG